MQHLPSEFEVDVIIHRDDILRLKHVLDPRLLTFTMERYPGVAKMLRNALVERSWYCARWLAGVPDLMDTTARERYDLAAAAIWTNDPTLMKLACFHPETLRYTNLYGESILAHLIRMGRIGMMQAVYRFWTEEWRNLTTIPERELLIYEGLATMQILTEGHFADAEDICERTLQRQRRARGDIAIMRHAIVHNDYKLVEYMSRYHESAFLMALEWETRNEDPHWYLYAAAKNNAVEVLALILPFIDIDQRCAAGNTMLHAAVSKACYATIRMLIAAGANPSIQNDAGLTPLMQIFQRRKRNVRAVALLAPAVDQSELFELGSTHWWRLDHDTLERLLFNPNLAGRLDLL